MARFSYRMQNILDIKIKLENQAKQELGSAQAALNAENRRMDELKERKAFYEKKAEELLEGTLHVRDIADNKAAILKMDDYIVDQKKRVIIAESNFLKAQNKVKEAMQERKMHEKLKETALEEFFEEEKKAESKSVDELTSYTYGQRVRN